MKTELKTAEQYVSEIKPVMGNLEYCAKNGKINGSIVDHLRQQLEEQEKALKYENKMALNATVANRFSEQLIGLRKAISLIDQLKAETKNT